MITQRNRILAGVKLMEMILSNCIIFSIFLIIIIIITPSCTEKKEVEHHHGPDSVKKEVIYYCPMDTQIVQKNPGICPICEMDLEPKSMEQHVDSIISEDVVYTPVNVSVLADIKSVKPLSKSVQLKIKVQGYITYDERRMNTISARTGGRIEKLHVKYNYQPIKKGHVLFEIFSHDLQTAQEEYIYLKRNDPNENGLLSAAKRKLLLLGMTEVQINKMNVGDHIHATTTVYSPYTGFVIEGIENKETLNSTSSMTNGSGMGSRPSMNELGKDISIKEGAYVDKGEAVFRVANTDVVWAVFEVYSNVLPQININQPVHIMLESTHEMIMGKINFIEPSYKGGDGTARVRVYLDNKNQNLKIGSILSGQIEAGEKKGWWIPHSSVYDLGRDKIVFVKKDGAFVTRKITIGFSSEKEIEVVSGLSGGEEIAENSQYMVDSESFIKAGKQ